MKKIHIIRFLLLWMMVSSCFTSYVSSNQVMQVQQGMSRQDVEKILGKPDLRRFDGDMEEWEFYRVSSALYGSTMRIIVHFVDGTVASMDTFDGDACPMPPPSVGISTPVFVASTPSAYLPQHGNSGRRSIMDRGDFDRFLSDFRMVIMPDDQVNFINDALLDWNFTSDQCRRVIEQIGFSDAQTKVMKRMYPQVVDKENFDQVVNKLFSSYDRDEMKKHLRNYHDGQRPGDSGYLRPKAMSFADFDRFYSNYKNESFESGRARLLEQMKPSTGFSCEQCRKLVELCTFDSEKKNMIKKLFPKIDDKNNFSVLTDMFTFEMDKRELREFAESYGSR